MTKLSDAIILCDFDGKIKTFDNKAEILFNYSSKDIVEVKRIYNLLHHDCILEFAAELDLFLNDKKKYLQKNIICTTSKNKNFSAILTLRRESNDLLKVEIKKRFDLDSVKSKLFNFNKINLILRSKFVIGSLVPFLFSIIWSFHQFNYVNYKYICLIFVAICLLHICANTFNDYFDWKSGRDKVNLDYVLFSTGGSRAIDFKFVSEKHLLLISVICLFTVIFIGSYFVYIRGIKILLIGVCGIFSVYFYSAPPIHLASRHGLGELMHIICLGPLIIAGSTLLLSESNISFIDFFIGLPFGLLITGCLLMNEYPDSKFDKISGKINLAVILGKKYIPYAYVTFQLLSFLVILIGIHVFDLTSAFYLILFAIPASFNTAKTVFKIGVSSQFISQSCVKSFNLYIYFSFILTLSLISHILYNTFYP